MIRFEDLSSKTQSEFITYYYENGPVRKKLRELGVNASHTNIHELFPPEEIDECCEYCGKKLQKKRLARSNTNEEEHKASVYCPECNHRPKVDRCECENCKQKPERLEEGRRKIIKEFWGKKHDKIQFSEIPFRGKVFLGVALRTASSEDMKRINPVSNVSSLMVPEGGNLRYVIMNDLAVYGAVVVSPDAPMKAFALDDNFPEVYYPVRMLFDVNVEGGGTDISLYQMLTKPAYFSRKFEVEALQLWIEIAAHECIEYLKHQLDIFKFKFAYERRTLATFYTLLNDYSVSQIYTIIWSSVSKLIRYVLLDLKRVHDLEKRVEKEKDDTKRIELQKKIDKHTEKLRKIRKGEAQEKVMCWCQSYGNLMEGDKKKIGYSNRIDELPQSEISSFFFNQVVKIGDKGFFNVPNMKDLEVD